jgi:phosphoglucosamine mutase
MAFISFWIAPTARRTVLPLGFPRAWGSGDTDRDYARWQEYQSPVRGPASRTHGREGQGSRCADIGLALDGDGDRLIVSDEHGQIVDGDHIMAICAQDLLKRRKLKKKTLVATIMSNMGLEAAMERMGGRMIRTGVGDRYVVECMRRKGFSFGGEQSGHLVFLDHITTGDGILASLQLLAIMKKHNRPLSELSGIMESFPQVLKNVRTAGKMKVDSIPGFQKTLKGLEDKLGTSGRILVRASGTEPVIRVMVEGQDTGVIDAMADELCDLVRKADKDGRDTEKTC